MSTDFDSPLSKLAAFAIEADVGAIPGDVRTTAIRGVIDLVGVCLGGVAQPDMTPMLQYVASTYAAGSSTALGIASPITAEGSAYANGVSAHVLDFDDCGDAIGGHPTVPVLPAVLALSEELETRPSDALAAYIVGVEVESALGLSMNYEHYERGWHPTATLGIFGATAASARLLGADRTTTEHALAIAASMSSGIKGNFGTLMKSGQVGFATAKGIAAARLAMAGMTANLDVFSCAHSFPAVYNGEESTDWAALEELGKSWRIVSPGLVFKLHPCCGSTHGSIDAMLEMCAHAEIDVPSIKKIEISLHPRRLPHVDRPSPTTGLAAKFSVQYVTTVAALRGAVTLNDFEDHRLYDDDVLALLPSVHVRPFTPEEQPVSSRIDCFGSIVEVVDANGTHRRSVPLPHGSDPALPVTDKELDAKFLANATLAIGHDQAGQALQQLRGWCTGTGSLRDFMRFLQSNIVR
jgi:2-methylcitrate dehydratase PrpD